MLFLVANLQRSLALMFKDKVILFLSMFPIILGGGLFVVAGTWIFKVVNDYGQMLIDEYISTGSAIVSVLLTGILSVLLFFIANYTFVMIVSIIASPFNDAISGRVEKLSRGETPEKMKATFINLFRDFISTVFNEIKKVALIGLLFIFAFVFSLIPFLSPIGLVLSALLVTIGFVDYNWSRNDQKFGDCFKELVKNIFGYTLAGLIFMGLLSIPVLNLFVLPLGAIYFSNYWTKRVKKVEGTIPQQGSPNVS